MKRFLAVSFLFLLVVLLCLLPVAATGGVFVCASVTTLPATNITGSTATLNGTVDVPSIVKITEPKGIISASLQYADLHPRVFVSFRYGTAPGVYTNETPQIMMTQSGAFQADIIGLPSCTNHYARTKVRTIINTTLFEQYRNYIQGAGVGLDYNMQHLFIPIEEDCPDSYGSEITFQTTGCPIGTGPTSHQSGGMTGVGLTAPPANPPIVLVQSAAVGASKVSPGENVDVTAAITNKGGSNGTSKVTLYINGQEAESKGITLSSGESATIHFSVSRNDPGTYTAYVNGVPAGSFTVDLFKNSDVLIYGIIALFLIGIIGVLYMVVKTRPA